MNFFTKKILSEFNEDCFEISIPFRNIKGILDLSKFYRLKKINCSNNKITEIIGLSNTIEVLICFNNNIKKFNKKNIYFKFCSFFYYFNIYNKIYPLSILPNNLILLNCSNNKIESLDYLPHKLEVLDCSFNQIKKLDYLPNLFELNCSYNSIEKLELLPQSIKILYCDHNQIKDIQNKPPYLDIIII